MHIVIITGMSGSGKTLALHTLEDQGYYCIDNLPIKLLEQSLQILTSQKKTKIAISIDIRGGEKNLKSAPKIINRLKKHYAYTEIVYLYADQETILKRFNETRRRHPLSFNKKSTKNIFEIIDYEEKLLLELSTIADFSLDTTHTDIYKLAFILKNRVCTGKSSGLSLMFQSFGFKYKTPSNSEFVFDARCLPNPYWVPELRILNGQDKAVQQWLHSHKEVVQMLNDITHYLDRWIPHFIKNQKAYLTVSIGCTGGQHRSVFLTEQLSQYFKTQSNYGIITYHRELNHRT